MPIYLKLKSFVHVMFGVGCPSARQAKLIVVPALTRMVLGPLILTTGASEVDQILELEII